MAKFCERCKHAMSAHDNHASCPQCRVAAGDCSVDPGNPCTICEGWTRKQWAKLRRSLIDARARMEHRGKQHWTVACPPVEAWILAKPASTSASEISSQAGEGDFVDERLVDTPKTARSAGFGSAKSKWGQYGDQQYPYGCRYVKYG